MPRKIETLRTSQNEEEIKEQEDEKVDSLHKAMDSLLDFSLSEFDSPDFYEKIYHSFREIVEVSFSDEDSSDIKRQVHKEESSFMDDLQDFSVEDKNKKNAKDKALLFQVFDKKGETGFLEDMAEEGNMKLTRTELRKMILFTYWGFFRKSIGSYDREEALNFKDLENIKDRLGIDTSKNEQLIKFFNDDYMRVAVSGLKKFNSVSGAIAFGQGLPNEAREDFWSRVYDLSDLIEEKTPTADDIMSYYNFVLEKSDKKEKKFDNFSASNVKDFIWRGTHQTQQRVLERARDLKSVLPNLKGGAVELVAHSIMDELTSIRPDYTALAELIRDKNEVTDKVKQLLLQPMEERAYYESADKLKAMMSVFNGEEKKEAEKMVAKQLFNNLDVNFLNSRFDKTIKDIRKVISYKDIIFNGIISSLKSAYSPEDAINCLIKLQELFKDDTSTANKCEEMKKELENKVNIKKLDSLLDFSANKEEILSRIKNANLVQEFIDFSYYFSWQAEVREEEVKLLLDKLSDKEFLLFLREGFNIFNENTSIADLTVKNIISSLEEWRENKAMIEVARVACKETSKLDIQNFGKIYDAIENSGVPVESFTVFLKELREVFVFDSSYLLNIDSAGMWFKDRATYKFAKQLKQQLGLEIPIDSFYDFTHYVADKELSTDDFYNVVREYAAKWPHSKPQELKKIYDLHKSGDLINIVVFLKKAGMPISGIVSITDFFSKAEKVISIFKKPEVEQNKCTKSMRDLKNSLLFYSKKENQPKYSKEKPKNLEFESICREFDNVGLRAALFGLETWGIEENERREIFGEEIINSVEEIKASVVSTPLDEDIYNSFGLRENEGYVIRFHGTKSREIASDITAYGQMIGHAVATGSYSGNISTAWGYCAGSGSIVSYLREDLRDSYINYGVESERNAVDEKNCYTRIPSRIIYNVSADTKEEVLGKAMNILRIREALKAKSGLETKIKEKFKLFLASQEEPFQKNIEAIYQYMRKMDYGEPKIIEVADFYVRQTLKADKDENAKKRKIVLEKILEATHKDKTGGDAPDIAIISDCLNEYDELIPAPEGEVKSEIKKKGFSRASKLKTPLLFDKTVEQISAMNSEQVERLLQRRVLRMQIEAARKSFEETQNSAVDRLRKQVENYIKLKDLSDSKANALRKKIKGHKALFLGEMNGEDLRVSNKAVLRIRKDLNGFHHDVIRLCSEKLEEKFADSKVFSGYKDRFELVLTGSVGRGDATLKSDIDCLVIFNDENLLPEERKIITDFFNQEYKSALTALLQGLGFNPDTGKAQQEGSLVALRSDLESLVIDPSLPVGHRAKIEPTNIIDLMSASRDKKGLVVLFKQEFSERFSEVSRQENLKRSLEKDIAKKHMNEWYKGFSQLLNGDRIRNLKLEIIRILDFNLFQNIAANLNKIKEIKGKEFIIPSDNASKIAILQEVGAITAEQAKVLKQASIDLFRWRLRNEVIQQKEMDPALLTNKERERATEYAKVMNDLIEDLVPQRGGKIQIVIS